MFRIRHAIAAGTVLAASLFAQASEAQTFVVKVATAGSSAQWGVFAVAAQRLAGGAAVASHATTKGTCGATPCAFLQDQRVGSTTPPQGGNLWIVWAPDALIPSQTDIWAYLSVDSVVGVSLFEATPKATLQIAMPFTVTNALNVWSADTAPPAGVTAALNNFTLTAVNTDIRPEDGLFATNRALANGYTTAAGVKEAISIGSSFASPIPFGLSTDPITSAAVDPFVTIPVGAAPIVFLANASNTTMGHLGNSALNNIDVATGGTNQALKLFSGAECDATVVGGPSTTAVSAILREPTSGTENTTEFTAFVGGTQETGVVVPTNNPLQATCISTGGSGAGSRFRAIGTGDEVKGVGLNPDSIGYVFFSYEAAPPTPAGGANSYKYLKVDGVDPLLANYLLGETPVCGTSPIGCPATHSTTTNEYTSFPHLRDGTYHQWSIYRVIADFNQPTQVANAQALVDSANIVADTTLPDFVPIYPACANVNGLIADEPGWQLYRQHFTPTGVVLPTTRPPFNPLTGGVEVANDGPNLFRNANPSGLTCNQITGNTYFSWYLGGTDPGSTPTHTEVGGDVGGTIVDNAGMQNTSPGATPLP